MLRKSRLGLDGNRLNLYQVPPGKRTLVHRDEPMKIGVRALPVTRFLHESKSNTLTCTSGKRRYGTLMTLAAARIALIRTQTHAVPDLHRPDGFTACMEAARAITSTVSH
jgi:hypothetical protein